MGTDYSISAIAGIVGGTMHSGDEQHTLVSELLIDSRRLSHPETTLFVALVTSKNDGHRFIQDLYEKGVRNFLVSRQQSPIQEANFVLVPDTLLALQTLAAYHRSRFTIPVIGITGSNGKTIIKEWLFHLVNHDRNIVRSPKSYNSQIGVTLSVMEMSPENDLAIFEAGISKPGEMEHLEPIIRPTLGIFTNIGHAHDENFSSSRQKAAEKLELFRHSEALIYCPDHKEIKDTVANAGFMQEVRRFTWSRKEEADLQISLIRKNQDHSEILGVYGGKEISITIPFTDEASAENAIHCWAAMLYMGFRQETIASRMPTLSPVEMRLELKEGINGCSLINDSYSLDIDSLSIALDFLNQQKQHEKRTVILSDILQSGKNPEDLYPEVSRLLVNKGVTRIIGIGEEISRHGSKFDIENLFYSSTEEFLALFSISMFRDETILLKGARIFGFERISAVLQQKVHETVLEINLDALVHNINHYRSLLKPGTKLMAMVKAFSYGSGSFEIANLMQFHRLDYLAVAYADEGVELRRAGITLPVLVMNPEEQSAGLLLPYDLEPEVYNLRTLEMVESLGQPAKVHVKLDTGMNRLGFEEHELDILAGRLKHNPKIKVQSVFSHLAASEDPSFDSFTRAQIELFSRLSDRLVRLLGYPVMRHILNSAGISRFPEAQFDMVRAGIGLYGVGFDAEEQSMLRNVATLKSTVSQIREIGPKESVGYGRAGKPGRKSLIATIGIGYADGFSRRLGNGKGRVFIHGTAVPVIGNVCMDLCMVDITELVEKKGIEVKEGDQVIIFGDKYPLADLANEVGTIPYEILTSLSRRIKRVYFHE